MLLLFICESHEINISPKFRKLSKMNFSSELKLISDHSYCYSNSLRIFFQISTLALYARSNFRITVIADGFL